MEVEIEDQVQLKELEIRCANGTFDGFDLKLELISKNNLTLPEAFKIVLASVTSHDYDRILDLRISDLGLKVEKEDQKLPSLHFEEDAISDLSLAYVNQLVLLFVGVSSLQIFMRENSSGPPSSANRNFNLCKDVLEDFSSCDALLSENGEYVSDNVSHKEVFVLSKIFLSEAAKMTGGSLTCGWWNMRQMFVHQRLLPDRIHRLHIEVVAIIGKTNESEWINEKDNSLSKLLFSVEAAQFHLHYHEVSAARKLIDSARDLVGLDIDLSGAYGKRTRFQQKAVAQLTVKLARAKLLDGSLPVDDCHVPKDLQLGDDTLLNKVSFMDGEETDVQVLTPEEQIVVLGYCLLLKRSEASDALLQEQIASYVSCLLEQPKVWSIYVTTLVLRCKLEKESSRRIERSLMQLESVVDSLRGKDPPFPKRALMLYAASFPLTWTLEKELADVQLSIGATKSALAIYEKLRLWQDVVLCLQLLGRTSQAELVVREQLQKQETPLLWCLLGDILDDPEMYQKAHELSGGNNARCQRSLGYHYYKRKDWSNCIAHFRLSLEINHLQSGVWFSMGYAALQEEDYPLAAKAYRQVVVLDPDNFEAWNNLANAYIRTNQKDRAWRSLQEALKCNYEEWRVWENFLLVSMDIGAFEDVIRAWHRLMDLKGKYVDPKVLCLLARAFREDLPDMSGQPISRLRRQALELLGRLSASVPNESQIWACYSELQCPDIGSAADIESLEKSLLHQQKAMRHLNAQQQHADLAVFAGLYANRCLELTMRLVALLEEGDPRVARCKSSTRMSVQSMLTKVRGLLRDCSAEDSDRLKDLVDNAEKVIGQLQLS